MRQFNPLIESFRGPFTAQVAALDDLQVVLGTQLKPGDVIIYPDHGSVEALGSNSLEHLVTRQRCLTPLSFIFVDKTIQIGVEVVEPPGEEWSAVYVTDSLVIKVDLLSAPQRRLLCCPAMGQVRKKPSLRLGLCGVATIDTVSGGQLLLACRRY